MKLVPAVIVGFMSLLYMTGTDHTICSNALRAKYEYTNCRALDNGVFCRPLGSESEGSNID